MIRFDDVHKRFGASVAALRGVSLTIEAGECVAVVGPNGAGKSTLLALALGFLHPTHGGVRIDGAEPRRFVRRHGAGWVPERFSLPRAWKVRATLRHFARLDGPGAEEGTETVLSHFGLEAHADRSADDLSLGLARRLALAIATVTPRRLMVFDEPTAGLDIDGQDRFRERCAWLRGNGATLLLATQDLAAVDRLADRAVLLDDGRLRRVVSLREPGPLSYRIELAQPFARFGQAFDDADGDADHRTFRVRVPNLASLNQGLRTLVRIGGIVTAVRPAGFAPEAPGSPPSGEESGA